MNENRLKHSTDVKIDFRNLAGVPVQRRPISHNLDVLLDNELSFENHISNLCGFVYLLLV